MEFDKEIKAKALLDEFVICRFGNNEPPAYLKADGSFTTNFEGNILRTDYEPAAQALCRTANSLLSDLDTGYKIRVCRVALQGLSMKDVAGEGDTAHFTPRKKMSEIPPAYFDQVSPEDLMDDFEPPSSDQTKEFKEN